MPIAFPIPVRAVIIDLDGTLLDTIPDLAAAANLMLRELRKPALPVDLVRTFVGKGIPKLVERTLEEADCQSDPEAFSRALSLFERHYADVNGRHTTIYPGVREGLELLARQDFPLACVTNKSMRFTEPLLAMSGLQRYFAQVVAGDTLSRKKPDPAPLLHACAGLGVVPEKMLMIGDSVNDAQAARSAGCPVFCVDYGYNEGEDVRSLDTDAIVGTIEEAVGLIRKA